MGFSASLPATYRINELINNKRKKLYTSSSYSFVEIFVKEFYDFITSTSMYDRDLDFKYFGVQIHGITDKIIFNEDEFWALNEEDFLETKKELLRYDDVREDVETSFINTGKSLYYTFYNETEWGMIFRLLENEGFMPFIQKLYSKKFDLRTDLKIVVFFKADF